MKKRVFICADRNFPRGDAGANRILFMAKALIEKGWHIIVISTGENNPQYYDNEKCLYEYEGVDYINIEMPKNKIKRVFEHNFIFGYMFLRLLSNKFKIDEKDSILLYTSNLIFSRPIIKYALKKKIGIACDIVEWHQPFQFQGMDKSLLYRWIMYPQYKNFFYRQVPRTKNVIAISRCLEDHFIQEGCNVVVIPIYVDVDNRKPLQISVDEKEINFIYPGNPYKKDDFLAMIEAINCFQEDERERIKLHLTGASMDAYRASADGKGGLFEKLLEEGRICYHSWMEYDELLALYDHMDFALLPRPIDITTKANFPSKVPEMLNKGIPIIMNRVGDVTDYLVDGEDAILYDGVGGKDCYNALKRAVNMPLKDRIKMKQSAYQNAKIKFDYHLCSEGLNVFFSTLKR